MTRDLADCPMRDSEYTVSDGQQNTNEIKTCDTDDPSTTPGSSSRNALVEEPV